MAHKGHWDCGWHAGGMGDPRLDGGNKPTTSSLIAPHAAHVTARKPAAPGRAHSFGVVHMCRFQRSTCAIKVLSADSAEAAAELLAPLVAEYEAMLQLRHPNVLLMMGIAADATGSLSSIFFARRQFLRA